MKEINQMSKVQGCMVKECIYNRDQQCHAKAITIGDDEHPRCDTLMMATVHVKARESAGVGACKSSNCTYNSDFECQAGNISVDYCEDHADCVTFEER